MIATGSAEFGAQPMDLSFACAFEHLCQDAK